MIELYKPVVNLDSYTKKDDKNLQELIAYYARVSNPDNQHNNETSEKLLRYLLKHKHWSPFEMVNVCMEITTTRDIAKQILRHRSFSFQEFSLRYSTASLGFCYREPRLQDIKNRQNSIELTHNNRDMEVKTRFIREQQDLIKTAYRKYHNALTVDGIAREQARSMLPEGNTYTKLYMNGTIRSWIHYISERTKKETQKEHRMVAVECARELYKVFPLIEEFVE